MAVLLALGSALAYGFSDFLGGILSRRTSAWAVAVVGQTSSAACVLALALVRGGTPAPADLAWAVLAGVGGGMGTGFLYRGFAAGRMAVVAPVSAVGAAVVPVLTGAATGERLALLVWLGVLVALPAIWLVSSVPSPDEGAAAAEPVAAQHGDRRQDRVRWVPAEGLLDGILAGLGFGLLFAALGQVPESAGLWPLALSQAVGVPAVLVLAVALRADWVPRGPAVRLAVLVGPLAASATALFLLATQSGQLAVAGVLASLYPASTVVLAAVVLHERVHRVQGLGLGLCAVAVVLVAGG